MKQLFIVGWLDSAVGMSQYAASSGGLETSELEGMCKGTVLPHLELLLQFYLE